MRFAALTSLLALLAALSLAAAAPAAPTHAKLDADVAEASARGGSVKVRVVIETRGDDRGVRAGVAAAGGGVKGEYGTLVEALVPARALESIAARGDVRYVRRPFRFEPMAVPGEGVATTNAAAWQAAGWGGAGVKVGVIDLGFADFELRQASGDLPRDLVTQNYCGANFRGEKHGTAVAEIVHEMAPRAQLFLICIDSEVGLGLAKDYAKAEGIRIVNFSAGTYNTSRGDGGGDAGTPDAIVRDARLNGILWVNSAGNEAQTHWAGAFSDPDSNRFHNFPDNETNDVTVAGKTEVCVLLKWDDWQARTQDYDLQLVNAGGTVVGGSANPQDGFRPPTEDACYKNESGATQRLSIKIAKADGGATTTPRFDLFVLDGYSLEHRVAAGSLPEPASSRYAMSVGAVCWQNGSLASYSSQGPTIDGRVKPDIAGPDSVSSATYGLFRGCPSGFTGTSASAPHVAGAAALLAGANRGLGADQLQAMLEGAAIDLGEPAKDSLYGAGTLQLPPAPPDSTAPTVPGLGAPASALQLAKTFAVSWSASDAETGVASYAVRYRAAAPGAGFGQYATWSGATSATSGTFAGSPGYTYCLSAQARDYAGNASGWGAERCTAVPLNNTALAHKGAWAKRSGSGYYLGTYSTSSARGAALVRSGVVARRLALVATRCPGCGTLDVYWNGTRVKRIGLDAATTRKRQVIPVAAFASPRKGTVKVVVASSRKPVKVEGLAVSKT